MEENKDLIIKERELREKIAEMINTSGLPAFVLKPIMQDFFNQLNVLEERQYQEAIGNVPDAEDVEETIEKEEK